MMLTRSLRGGRQRPRGTGQPSTKRGPGDCMRCVAAKCSDEAFDAIDANIHDIARIRRPMRREAHRAILDFSADHQGIPQEVMVSVRSSPILRTC